jgi:hypothetical protein
MARIVAGVVAIAAVAVAGVFVYEWLTLRAARNHTEASRDPLDPWRRYRLEPTVAPAVEAADAAGLNDAEIVVGVVVGGRARAYRLDAMRDREKHVVNDMIGGVAVSVAYCDLTDCVRGYTDASAAQPLDVAVEGLYLGEMAIKAHGGLHPPHGGRRAWVEGRSSAVRRDRPGAHDVGRVAASPSADRCLHGSTLICEPSPGAAVDRRVRAIYDPRIAPTFRLFVVRPGREPEASIAVVLRSGGVRACSTAESGVRRSHTSIEGRLP